MHLGFKTKVLNHSITKTKCHESVSVGGGGIFFFFLENCGPYIYYNVLLQNIATPFDIGVTLVANISSAGVALSLAYRTSNSQLEGSRFK